MSEEEAAAEGGEGEAPEDVGPPPFTINVAIKVSFAPLSRRARETPRPFVEPFLGLHKLISDPAPRHLSVPLHPGRLAFGRPVGQARGRGGC